MVDEIVWRYELGCPHDALKATSNNIGRYTYVGWMPKKSFGTRWGEIYLLTSPFIERIPRISQIYIFLESVNAWNPWRF